MGREFVLLLNPHKPPKYRFAFRTGARIHRHVCRFVYETNTDGFGVMHKEEVPAR